VQKELGATLRRIAEKGADGFYKGETAELLIKEMKAGGGLITAEDLAVYKAKLRQPIHGSYRGYDVYAPPPPSSGGVCLVQMLNVLENFDLKKQGRFSAPTLHVMAEAMRRAYADRARHLGDQDFVKIPAHLTSKEYAKKLAASIDRKKATPSADVAKDIPLRGEGDNTTHFSVIDGDGMAVSNTYTLENGFGSKVVVKGAGFILNNEMGDFNTQPGVTNNTGRIGTDANLIAPGKRMLSSMTPTIVTTGGKLALVTGSPGGRTIINTVLDVVLNVTAWRLTGREAVDAPRMHHQWLPDRLTVEANGLAPEVLEALKAFGHTVNAQGTQGSAQTIWIHPITGTAFGVADKRDATAKASKPGS
jgi:gamma-glutamyltranspeptidase/glutathione hydrolase